MIYACYLWVGALILHGDNPISWAVWELTERLTIGEISDNVAASMKESDDLVDEINKKREKKAK